MKRNEQQAFETLISLPTELSIAEVSVIVNRLPYLPTLQKNFWEGRFHILLYFFLFLSFVIGGVVWFFGEKKGSFENQVSFIEKKAKEVNVGDLKNETGDSEEPEAREVRELIVLKQDRDTAKISINMEDISEQASIAPTSSHTDTFTSFSKRKSRSNLGQVLPSPQSLIIQGKWKARKEDSRLCFELRLEEDGENWKSRWVIPICTGEEEIETVGNPLVKQFSLVRESGKIHFFQNLGMAGTYKFEPDEAFMENMVNRMLNVREIPLESLTFSGSHKQNWEGQPIYSNNPYALLWLKFFLVDINESYLGFLQEQGYSGQELQGIWHLADQELPLSYIREVLPSLKTICSSVSLEKLSLLYQMGTPVSWVKSLEKATYADLSVDHIISMNQLGIEANYIQILKNLGFENIPVSELIAAWTQELTPEFIELARRKGYSYSQLGDYLNLRLRHMGYPLPDYSQESMLTSIAQEMETRTIPIPSFTKLIAKGNIRVLIKRDTLDEITIYSLPDFLGHIQAECKSGVLRISPRSNFKSVHTYDVKVSSTLADELITRNGARIYAYGEFKNLKSRGSLFSAKVLNLPDSVINNN